MTRTHGVQYGRAMTTTERLTPLKLSQKLQELAVNCRTGREFSSEIEKLGLGLDASDRRALMTSMDKLDFVPSERSSLGDSWLVAEGEPPAINFRGHARHVRHVLYQIVHNVELEPRTNLVQMAGKPKSVNPMHQRLPEFGESARKAQREYEENPGIRIPVSGKRGKAKVITTDMLISERIERRRNAKGYTRSQTAKMLGMDYQRLMKLMKFELKNWKADELLMASEALEIELKDLMKRPQKAVAAPSAYGEGLSGGSPASRTDYRDRGQWEPEHA